jgi:DNA-directed RNA polymerase specialized sigma24 family protein
MSQAVSGLRSQVSGLRSQVSGLKPQVSSLNGEAFSMSRENPRANGEDTEITLWLRKARDGDESAFAELFHFYVARVREYVTKELTAQDRRQGFADDLASECLTKVWRDLNKGCIGSVSNRDELWYAMMRVAKSCAVNRRNYLRRSKRFMGIPIFMDALLRRSVDSESIGNEFEYLELWETFAKTLTDQQREIVSLKMDGFDNREIAVRIDSVERRVAYKLQLIRTLWDKFVVANFF